MATGGQSAVRVAWSVASTLTLMLASCAGSDVGVAALAAEPLLEAPIPGWVGGRIVEQTEGERPSITKLFEVDGAWEAASVALALAVREHGWEIERINCVGTGNDVIARKQVDGTWLLLESGAGSKAAGMIVSIDDDQGATEGLSVGGRCPPELVDAAGS